MLETLWSITMSTKVPDHEISDICAFQSISFDRKRTSIDERRQLVWDLLPESGHCGRFERVCQVECSLDCAHFDSSQRRLYRRATRSTSKARLFRWLLRTGILKFSRVLRYHANQTLTLPIILIAPHSFAFFRKTSRTLLYYIYFNYLSGCCYYLSNTIFMSMLFFSFIFYCFNNEL